ncbi:hypothetical protein KKC34_12330 [bacterium]|nr:hypothetical protein [bacterium]
MQVFKNDLPDDCPEGKYKTCDFDFNGYHITKSFPPCSKDFETQVQKNLKKGKNPPKQLCKASGLSVLKDITDVVNIADTFPENGKYILKGIVRYNLDGVVKQTPHETIRPSHHTWYPFKGVDESEVFKELEREHEKRD